MKVAFYTLGCKVNQYESQTLSERFRELGFDVVDANDDADVYVINSCTVTGMADKKSRNYARRAKRKNPQSLLALIGCYVQTSEEKIREEMPDIDLLLNSEEKTKLPERVLQMLSLNEPDVPDLPKGQRYVSDRTRAYLKIEDGCDRFCAYCVIPYARGPVRSRPIDEILREAESLLSGGCKEIILTGINTALYGTDMPSPNEGLIDIVRALSECRGDFRIRLSSVEPTVINAAYAEKLASCEKLCPHFHLSLQSGSDRILAAMGRNYRMKEYREIIHTLRKIDPHFAISTDIITGFPGEDEAAFQEGLTVIEEIGFSFIHVFKYSKRPGTVAASMPNQVSEVVKSQRSEVLMQVAERAESEFYRQNVGTKRQVLFLREIDSNVWEGVSDNGLIVQKKSQKNLYNCFQDIEIEQK
jgi:threonylcarbamoyladenosine tRNA methylthiotransferase MtaB